MRTRERMVVAAAGLLGQGGTGAASFTDVLSASGAARGAIYHHFPGGKDELTREAVAWTGRRVRTNLASLSGTGPLECLDAFLDAVRPIVMEASLGRSCAVAAVVIETGQVNAGLTETAQAALRSWVETIAERLVAAGADPAAAQTMSAMLVVFLEGTQVLCRASGDLQPFDGSVAAIRAAARTLLVS